MKQRKKTARNGCNHYAPMSTLVKTDAVSIARARAQHERYENFQRGSLYAAIALCGMFAFLSCGVVMFGW